MAANILEIPFRRTHNISLSDALKEYISAKYDQHPDMFAADLAAIDALRAEAVTVQEPHASGVRKLATYAAQLVWLAGKFPVDIGVEFAWWPALGFATDRPVAASTLRFELANVLFNLAALHAQLAFALPRGTVEGLKHASNYFCQAAGVLAYLRDDVVPDMHAAPPEDMDVHTLESLEQLMLAQAQECSWSIAVKNGYKDAFIAKLAAKVSDFYDQAAEHGMRSDAISTAWMHHMSAKHHHFAGAAQYRAACDCLEKRKYGEEVARLKDALTCVNEALKESKHVNKTVQGDVNGLKMKVTDDLKRAEKDNDVIYLHNVPSKSELETLARTSMAQAKMPTSISDPSSSLGEHGSLGQPLFTRLVPYSVHLAASIYADRRDRVVNTQVIDALEALTDQLRDLLQSLNLPGSLQALEKPLGLPPSLTAHAEEIRQQDGLHRLRRAVREVDSLKDADVHTYQEGVASLQSEASEDERARTKQGTERWTRPPSQQAGQHLYSKAAEIEGYLKSAASSDELVKTKLSDVEPAIKVLEGTNRDLEEYVPSSRRVAIPPKLEQEASWLRDILNEIGRVESRRRRKAEALRNRAKADDINPILLNEVARIEREFPMQKIEAVQFEDLFTRRLSDLYDRDCEDITAERTDQDHLVERLQRANSAFTAERRGGSGADPASRAREQALQRLEAAHRRYIEIGGNLDAARKFYNDLARIVGRFRDDARDFRHQRHAEAAQLEADLANAMSALSLAQSGSLQDRREKQALRAQHRGAGASGVSGVNSAGGAGGGEGLEPEQAPRQAPPLPAPQPTRAPVAPMVGQVEATPAAAQLPGATGTWKPNMGIRFGAGQSAGGAAPPPSNVHNPTYPNTRLGGQWSPSRGVRFG